MLVARVFLAAVLLRATFTSEEKNHSHLSRVLRLSDEEEPEYFVQCSLVNIWKEQLGRVSVLAFLDPAWLYSYRQAVMLQLLSSRLRKSGFPDIRFFVITPPPDLMEDKSENEIEIEAWRDIAAMSETRHIVNAKDQLLKDDGPEMINLQDGPRFRMWERFRASKDQVVVIDRCGKLTYQVIVPWSILYFPYVKAAILSTYQEDPCGGCDPAAHRSQDDKEYSLNLTNNAAKETDSRETGDVSTPVWTTTERLEKFTAQLNESLEEDREATIASSIIIDEVTDIDRSDHLTESSVKYEAICQYDNGATNPDTEETQNQEQSISWTRDDSTISSETAATFDLQEESPYTPISIEDNTVTASYADTKDRTLLLDEPIDRIDEIKTSLSPIPETTISDAEVSDEARDNGERTTLKENAPPLHIIMHAPHVHRNGKKTKKHTYLILKTNDPEFHGHLDSEIDVIPPSNLQWDADFQANTEEYNWEAIKVDTEEKDAGHQKYIFDKDESPGLFGEVADYWKSYEDSDIIDRNETINDNTTITYKEEHHANISDHTIKLSKSSEIDESYPIANLTGDTSIKNSTNSQNIVELEKTGSSKPNIVNNQAEREEGQINLIEHYSKLLSWIDYRLNK
ncbi:uncharacterized protein [Linepithema humile]|uniref:uncharacterized protein n=1 Tax=Linepithema humile TaxID=83485 RepID=UPI0006235174|nr:PREDICTED: uncharacterized protein LOC105668362 [Linepithema humile]